MTINGTSLPELQGLAGLQPAQPALPDAFSKKGTLVDIGPIDSIAVGQGRSFIVNGRLIAVFRQRDGRVFVIDNQCPHRGGPLAEGLVGDGKVICPLHGWKVDLANGRCLGEAASVRTYDVQVVDERIFVECGMPSPHRGMEE